MTLDGTDTVEEWELAGQGWSHAATDWAYLFEPYARDAIELAFARTALGPGKRLLDVACGSGLALARAERLGARVAGIDAASALVQIAARRAPTAELVHGSMFDLPWEDDTFDAVTSFNGIWGDCDEAVAEIARVLRPGGRVVITFWGASSAMDLRDYFITLGTTGPGVGEELKSLARIGAPGVAESMLSGAGLTLEERGDTWAMFEWPDEETAWRALRSPGVALPSLRHTGEAELRARVLDAVAPFRAPDGSYVLRNQLTHVIATR